MEITEFVIQFAANERTIRSLSANVPYAQSVWKPSPKEWSIVEVINHLCDEEKDDFRLRLDLLFHHPGTAWPLVEPEKWCVVRQYNERDLEDSLNDFSRERGTSLIWLAGLGDIDWGQTYAHPRLGDLAAGDILSSWLAHDYYHIRQLTRLHYQYAAKLTHPYSTTYAGEW
jgi:hypothetical protein